jgi:hypothetical protein
MAIIDQTNDLGDLAGLEASLGEAVAAPNTPPAPPAKEEVEDPKIPDKFKGKTAAEIAESYTNLEKRFGGLTQDLGTQRKLTDQLLDLKRADDLSQAGGDREIEISSTELLDDPTGSVKKLVEQAQHKEVSELRGEINALREKEQFDSFTSKHSDAVAIAESTDFHEWAAATQYRQGLLEQAKGRDYSAADSLITEYKLSLKSIAPDTDDSSEEVDGLSAAKKVGLESSGSAEGSNSGGKIYRRADLMRLRIEKPDLYKDPAYQAEIMKAYAEDRVK